MRRRMSTSKLSLFISILVKCRQRLIWSIRYASKQSFPLTPLSILSSLGLEDEELHTSLSLLEEEIAKVNCLHPLSLSSYQISHSPSLTHRPTFFHYRSMAEKAQELAKILTSAIGDSEDEEQEQEEETEPQVHTNGNPVRITFGSAVHPLCCIITVCQNDTPRF